MDKIENHKRIGYTTLSKLLNKMKFSQILVENYMKLLSQLTSAPQLSQDIFMTNLEQISKMGEIQICFLRTYEPNETDSIQIIGSGTIIFEPKLIRGGAYVGHIEDIVVDEKYRSMGIAKKIIENLIELAEEKGCYKVILDCQKELCGFYEKSGFENHGVQMSKYFV